MPKHVLSGQRLFWAVIPPDLGFKQYRNMKS